MSPARRLGVLPSVMSSVRLLGRRVEAIVSISVRMRALPVRVLGARWTPGDVLVGAPRDLEGDVLVAGKQVEYLVLLTKRE